jgi:ABC-type antimicrobial peptide transport system permease subunit
VTIATKTVFPTAAFHHIGLMMCLMSVLISSALFGYLSVNKIVEGWFRDVSDRLMVEILAFDVQTESVLTQETINQTTQDILKTLNNDPIIQNITMSEPERSDSLDIPSPVFLKLNLIENRANNAEQRLVELITQNFSNVAVQSQESWETDIQRMATSLKTAFFILSVSILVVVIVMITGIVKTQLKASDNIIKLIHLMGASPSSVRHLFQLAMIRSVSLGTFTGICVLGALISPLIHFLHIDISILHYWGILLSVFCGFIIISYCVTGLTVDQSLKDMP